MFIPRKPDIELLHINFTNFKMSIDDTLKLYYLEETLLRDLYYCKYAQTLAFRERTLKKTTTLSYPHFFLRNVDPQTSTFRLPGAAKLIVNLSPNDHRLSFLYTMENGDTYTYDVQCVSNLLRRRIKTSFDPIYHAYTTFRPHVLSDMAIAKLKACVSRNY